MLHRKRLFSVDLTVGSKKLLIILILIFIVVVYMVLALPMKLPAKVTASVKILGMEQIAVTAIYL